MTGKSAQTLLLTVILAAGSSSVFAGFASYHVGHNAVVIPTGGNVLPQVLHNYYDYAEATQPFVKQGPFTGPVPVPPAGGTFFNQADAVASAEGHAWSWANVNPYVVGGPVTGQIQVGGWALAADNMVHHGYGVSTSQILARGGRMFRNGRIQWGNWMEDHVTDNAFARGKDPISFTLLDLEDGTYLEDTLLDIETTLGKEDQELTYPGGPDDKWLCENNQITVTARYATLLVDISSPYTVQQGTATLTIDEGFVVESVDTGMFDGLLPSVGTLADNLSFAFPSEFTLDYDLGEFNGHELDINLNLGNGGNSTAVEIPEPATLCLLLLGGLALRRR